MDILDNQTAAEEYFKKAAGEAPPSRPLWDKILTTVLSGGLAAPKVWGPRAEYEQRQRDLNRYQGQRIATAEGDYRQSAASLMAHRLSRTPQDDAAADTERAQQDWLFKNQQAQSKLGTAQMAQQYWGRPGDTPDIARSLAEQIGAGNPFPEVYMPGVSKLNQPLQPLPLGTSSDASQAFAANQFDNRSPQELMADKLSPFAVPPGVETRMPLLPAATPKVYNVAPGHQLATVDHSGQGRSVFDNPVTPKPTTPNSATQSREAKRALIARYDGVDPKEVSDADIELLRMAEGSDRGIGTSPNKMIEKALGRPSGQGRRASGSSDAGSQKTGAHGLAPQIARNHPQLAMTLANDAEEKVAYSQLAAMLEKLPGDNDLVRLIVQNVTNGRKTPKKALAELQSAIDGGTIEPIPAPPVQGILPSDNAGTIQADTPWARWLPAGR